MGARLHFLGAKVAGDLDELIIDYKAVHSDTKLIVDHDIVVRQQTRFTKNKTTASMQIKVETEDGIEPALDKLADHLERMAKAIREREGKGQPTIPTFTIGRVI